jgi:hypothetical protein
LFVVGLRLLPRNALVLTGLATFRVVGYSKIIVGPSC